MSGSALGPVSVAVYSRLTTDSALMAALPGGWHDDVPQSPTYPFGWYEVRERDVRGFGSGEIQEVELRTHIFSVGGLLAGAYEANRLTVARLKDVALTVTGYAHCGRVIADEVVPLGDQELNGVKVHELVSFFRIYVEAS